MPIGRVGRSALHEASVAIRLDGMRRSLKLIGLALLAVVAAAALFVISQARRTPTARPEYVALGSSFAAGAGLGRLQDGSPLLCARGVGGYPQQLSRKIQMSTVDMSCGGAFTRHVLRGGQFFQGPQIRVINQETRLITITVGGNDIGYIGDLSMLAARRTETLFGWLVRNLWRGPKTLADRNYPALQGDLILLLAAIHRQAPNATVVLAAYPTILPPKGTCPIIGLNNSEADLMRETANQLASVTRLAAERGGAIFVDMHSLGAGHSACSQAPWTNGWTNGGVAPFHPTSLGARRTAEAILRAINQLPTAVSAVDHDDAARHQARRVRRQE